MMKLNIQKLNDFVNQNINIFHNNKVNTLITINLGNLLRRKNPYLFRAKHIITAAQLVTDILDAYLYASEEKLFGDFLEELVIYISDQVYGGRKSAATGIDLEFLKEGVYYLVSVKSGPNWGNSSQQRKQEQDFQQAVKVLKQSRHVANVQPVLGICYGKTRTTTVRGYLKIVGQNFWYLVSGNKNLYIDIIEPIGFNAKIHNDAFLREKAKITNLLTHNFIREFCKRDGAIDWKKLVKYNSGNLP